MRGVLLLVSMMVFAVFTLSAQAASPRTILVFGDSLSAGYGLPQDKAWVSLLGARLKQQRIDYTVANASISGETTLGGLKRINAALTQHKPAIVVLALGANDGLRGQSTETMRSNLHAMIQACRKANTQVLLVGMRIPPNYGTTYTSKFHAVFLELAQRDKLPLVPFLLDGFADQPAWFQADGIHPDSRAQPVMLDTVWKALGPLVASDKKINKNK